MRLTFALLAWLIVPIGIAWATYRFLAHQHPRFRARAWPAVALGFSLGVGGTLAFFRRWPGEEVVLVLLILPVLGSALGYYTTRKPLTGQQQP